MAIWNKGLKYTDKQKSALNIDGLSLGHQKGRNNQNWKGAKASYSAIHYWIYRNLGKAKYCLLNQEHKSTRYHWANISGNYQRDEADYLPLCPSCHFYFDNVGEKMWNSRKNV